MNKIITLLLIMATGLFAQAQEPLTLTNAIEKALINNYNIVIATENQRIAEIQNNWGTAGRYPYINLSVSDNNSLRAIEGDNTTTVGLSAGASINWTIFDGFSVKINKTRLEELENLSKNNAAVLVESTIQSVILAYYDVLLQKAILATYKEVMELSQDRFEKAEQQKEYGSAVTYDVLQAQNAYLSDRAKYLLQEVAFKNSKRNLAYLMAETEPANYDYTDKFEAIPEDYNPGDLRAQMITNNKSLQNQYINQRLLENAVVAAKSAFSPSLNFSGGVSGTRLGTKIGKMDMGWGNSANFYGNFNLSWNLFSGGNRKRALQIAEIDNNIAEVELSEMQHELDNSLANLFEYYQVRKELLVVADENLAAAELNLQISRDKFEAGAINSFNFRDVQEIYLHAAQGKLEAIYNFINAQTSLLRLTGVIIQEYE